MKERHLETDVSLFSSRLDVDLDALVHNLEYVKAQVAPAKVIAVMKANALGHGTLAVGRALESADATMIAVSNFMEALLLRRNGVRVPLLAFNGLTAAQMRAAVRHEISFFGHDLLALELANRIACEEGSAARVHLKVDTGMGRKGILPGQASEVTRALPGLKHVVIEGVASHLASPYDPAHDYFSNQQYEAFVRTAKALDPDHSAMWHFAASSGAVRFPSTYLDAVRTGALLFGVSRVWPLPWALKPVASYSTVVTQVKPLPRGHNVGYRLHYTAPRDMQIGIIPVGSVDGLTGEYGDTGQVLIRGRRCPLVGICSCEAMVDVTGLGVLPGDSVVLFGAQGDQQISAVECAEMGKQGYANLLTRIPARVPRVYLRNGQVVGTDSIIDRTGDAC